MSKAGKVREVGRNRNIMPLNTCIKVVAGMPAKRARKQRMSLDSGLGRENQERAKEMQTGIKEKRERDEKS